MWTHCQEVSEVVGSFLPSFFFLGSIHMIKKETIFLAMLWIHLSSFSNNSISVKLPSSVIMSFSDVYFRDD